MDNSPNWISPNTPEPIGRVFADIILLHEQAKCRADCKISVQILSHLSFLIGYIISDTYSSNQAQINEALDKVQKEIISATIDTNVWHGTLDNSN